MPATDDDTLLPFSLPNICKKKVTAAFDGGQVSYRLKEARDRTEQRARQRRGGKS